MSHNYEPETLLTVPDELEDTEELFLTGNEFVSLPQITPGGAIMNLNVLRLDQRGLLEFAGTGHRPLLAPVITLDEEELNLKENAFWHYALNWMPGFTYTNSKKHTITGEVYAPPGFKGFCYRVSVKNDGRKAAALRLQWQGCLDSFNYLLFNRRPVKDSSRVFFDRWTGSLVLEGAGGMPLAALALACEPETCWECEEQDRQYRAVYNLKLKPGENFETVIFGAVNLEADGAATTGIDLRRQGASFLKEKTSSWLKERQVTGPDPSITDPLNRNLFFCHFYSLGRSLDGEALVPVTSRSPRYYVSSAFWSRDTLLWSFPAIMTADQPTARELLLTVYERHVRNAGDHAHYIDGTVLYPGFELDQLAAFIIALEHYTGRSDDLDIISDKVITTGLNLLIDRAFRWFDPHSGLYSTFLGPSDDPVSYPFLTYNNALLQRSFSYLSQLQQKELFNHKSDFAILARELMQAIFDHCMVKGPFGPMFAWAVDGAGRFSLYDNPPGSLQLLCHYGFCSSGDIVFRNTVRWIRSSNNRFYHQGCNFEEAGSIHAKSPWPMGACNNLLACNDRAVDFLTRAPMDNGFFCESIDPDSGRVLTGAAFASGAGFMAHALEKTLAGNTTCEDISDDGD